MRTIAVALLAVTTSVAAQAQRFDARALAATHSYDGRSGYETLSRPGATLFSAKVPEGNYRVTAILAAKRATTLAIKAEDRRLMVAPVALRKGARATRDFIVNVRTPALPVPPDRAPGSTAVRLSDDDRAGFTWDDRLTIEVLGDVTITALEIAPVTVPTIYLVGDSTVTDQAYEPAASWGQMLPALLDDRVAVANHAKSGATLKSFMADLRLAKVLSTLGKGDWLVIQFGHNDQKAQWPQTYADPVHAYPAWLRAYVAEARASGATPVIVTSPERRTFEGTTIRSTLIDHVAAAKRVAAQQDVALIDLNAASRAIYEALGPERAPLAFNDGGKDATHHDNYGAWLLANAVADGMRAVPDLAPHVIAPRFDPARPPLPEAVAIPPSARSSAQRPAGN